MLMLTLCQPISKFIISRDATLPAHSLHQIYHQHQDRLAAAGREPTEEVERFDRGCKPTQINLQQNTGV